MNEEKNFVDEKKQLELMTVNLTKKLSKMRDIVSCVCGDGIYHRIVKCKHGKSVKCDKLNIEINGYSRKVIAEKWYKSLDEYMKGECDE